LTILLIVGMVGMSILDLFVLRSYQHPAEGVLMLFPLRSGIYVVTNGGNGILGIGMNNYVHKFPWSNGESQPQKAYAVDIMEMTTGGRVGKGILPSSKLDYEIYTEPVYSPCFGQVIYVEDGHTDVDLFEETTELGNYVVIQCVDYYITMGNFRKGTINVAVGERITVNRQVGQVGNSGTPAIPHLHMFATKGGWENGEGEPVPMFFERAFSVDNFLVRNEVQIR
jgi:hypothetical protein